MSTFWLSYITRSFLRSGRRALFAILCVTVGVAGVVALETAGLTVQNALTSNIRASNGGDISLRTDESPLSRADLTLFARLQKQGKISTWTAVSTVHATAVGSGGRLVPFEVDIVRIPPYPLGGEPPFSSPSDGTVRGLLSHQGDVLVTTVLAQELGVGAGNRLTVNGIGGTGLHATVRGVLAGTTLAHSAAMTIGAWDTRTVTSAPPRYTAVYVNLSGSPNAVTTLLRNRYPTANVQTVAEALQTARQQVHDFQQFLLLVGLLALLIAGVGILNAIQSILARRRLEIAMLKSMGFREWALYVLFGGEAMLMGLIGGVLGVTLGVLGSSFITDALARAAAIQVTYVVDAGTLLAGVALGAGATLVFAALPIVQATALRPLEVLREGTIPPASSWVRTALLLILIFLLFTILAAVALGDAVLATWFVVGAAAVCAVLGVLFALAVGWVGQLGPTASGVRGGLILLALTFISVLAAMRAPSFVAIVALITLLFGLTVVLPQRWLLPLLIGARSLSRRRTRSALMLVAFLAGILSMTVTLTVATGLQSQISAALASNGSSNLIVVGSGKASSAISRASRSLLGIKGRTVMTTVSTEPVKINGRGLASVIGPSVGGRNEDRERLVRSFSGITGWALAQGQRPSGITIVDGRPLSSRDSGTSNVIVPDRLEEYPTALRVGDSITLRETGTGTVKTVQIVGFYSRPRRGSRFSAFFTPPLYADQRLTAALGGSDVQTVVAFTADQSWLAHDAAILQRLLPGMLVIDVGDLTAIVDTILNELLHLLVVLTALVLGAGVAVVANGVALAMLERRREIALFKAIGFGPGSVESFVLVENALIGTLAGAASVLITAIMLGILSHFALQQAIGFDPILAVEVLMIATFVGLVTAYFSSRGPIGVRPLEALRNE